MDKVNPNPARFLEQRREYLRNNNIFHVYIAGPMRGYPDLNIKAFAEAAARIRAMSRSVVSPHELNGGETRDVDYDRHFTADVKAIISVDAVYAISGWEYSTGAMTEILIALLCGKTVFVDGPDDTFETIGIDPFKIKAENGAIILEPPFSPSFDEALDNTFAIEHPAPTFTEQEMRRYSGVDFDSGKVPDLVITDEWKAKAEETPQFLDDGEPQPPPDETHEEYVSRQGREDAERQLLNLVRFSYPTNTPDDSFNHYAKGYNKVMAHAVEHIARPVEESLPPTTAENAYKTGYDEGVSDGYIQGVNDYADKLESESLPEGGSESLPEGGSTESVLQEAQRLIHGPRQAHYGHPALNHQRIAGMWSSYLGQPIHPHDVWIMMVLLKCSRLRNGYARDTVADIAGYAGVGEMIQEYIEQGHMEPFDPPLSNHGVTS